MVPPNVTLIGHASRAELIRLMQTAKALIVAADEDLGLTPMEAQSCGTPVIALRKGGYLETVLDGETGIFFDEPSPAAIAKAVDRFEAQGVRCSAAGIREHMTAHFSPVFRAEIKALVDAELANHARR